MSLAFGPDHGELIVLRAESHDVCFEVESGRETTLRPGEAPGTADPNRDAGDFQIVPIGDHTVGVRARTSRDLLARFTCPEKIGIWLSDASGE